MNAIINYGCSKMKKVKQSKINKVKQSKNYTTVLSTKLQYIHQNWKHSDNLDTKAFRLTPNKA